MFRYKITDIYKRETKTHVINERISEDYYYIKHLAHGSGAILYGESGRRMETSKVESIHIWENSIRIETKNTIYTLKPVLTGVV